MALKQANPGFPILIRECSGVRPRLWARYGEWGPSAWGCPPCGGAAGSPLEWVKKMLLLLLFDPCSR